MDITEAKYRLFVGMYPCGIVFADRGAEEAGDYKRLAFLPYRELVIEYRPRVCAEFRKAIAEAAAPFLAKRGQEIQVSTCGQTVLLGERSA